MNWYYFFIMFIAVATGAIIYRRTGVPLDMTPWQKAGVGLGAFCGGMIGAKLPFLLADWQAFLDGTAWLQDGKTIVSGLVGGYLGVQIAEWAMGIKSRMCDGFAVPLAAAIGIGRIGCFVAGCCYGKETSLPWGVCFHDHVPRHPTQLYESAFHLTAAIILYHLQKRGKFPGQLVKIYFTAYFIFRFFTEFLRPETPLWLGLTGYQWASLVLVPFFYLWCSIFCGRPRRNRANDFFPLRPDESSGDGSTRVLKTGGTVCPTCLKPLEGKTVERGGKVFLERHCPEHGRIVALANADRRLYYLRDEVPHAPPLELKQGAANERMTNNGMTKETAGLAILAAENGPCSCSPKSDCCMPGHKTCIALLEITEACNLRCPVCFAASPGGGHRPVEELFADLDKFLASRAPLDILQLSGGEPLLHPQLLEIIDRCKTLPIKYIAINTNGLELLSNEKLAGEIASREARMEINLQIDGFTSKAQTALRGVDLTEQKQAIVAKLAQLGLRFTLVCTVARRINEDQLGALVRFGMSYPSCRGITFQTAVSAGRFQPEFDPMDRVTMADVVRLLVEQTSGHLDLGTSDFKPLPCSNPNCCSFTGVARPKNRRPMRLMPFFDYEKDCDQLADRLTFSFNDVKECCGREGNAEDFFRIVIKPFMDAHTFDADRASECCVHIIRPGGSAVSFCRHNTLERGRA